MKKLCSKQIRRQNRGDFATVAKIPLCFSDLHSASKSSLKLQKLIQEKFQKSEKQARTKINLKIRENLKRKVK